MVSLTESFFISKNYREIAMYAESSGMFTLKEINRVKIIQDVIERRMTTHRADTTVIYLTWR